MTSSLLHLPENGGSRLCHLTKATAGEPLESGQISEKNTCCPRPMANAILPPGTVSVFELSDSDDRKVHQQENVKILRKHPQAGIGNPGASWEPETLPRMLISSTATMMTSIAHSRWRRDSD